MTTKYQELKNSIKANAELSRVLKNHRKTVRFEGERLKSFNTHVTMEYYKNGKFETEDKGFVKVEEELTPSLATKILLSQHYKCIDGGTIRYQNPSAENAHLYVIYGILRNERKTKKVKVWEDIVNSPSYEKYWKKEVDKWRDEETICADKQRA
jgi:hypothetical protein